MNNRLKTFLCAAAACLALLCGGCTPSELLGLLTEDEKPVNERLENEISEREDTLEGVGYSALRTEADRRAYAMIDYSAQSASDAKFTIDNDGTLDDLSAILDLYKGDHPEVFWLNDNGGYEYIEHDSYTEIRLLYSVEGEELIAAKKRLNERTKELLDSMPQGLDKYGKELWLNDLLVGICEYDDEAAEKDEVIANEQNAYGALVDGKAVCEGYTRAFQLLCAELGIECVSVNGTSKPEGSDKEENHIWNAVKLDGDWYYVDVTWNDVQAETDEYELTEIEKHLYFNITTERLLEDHHISPLYGSGEEAEYYNAFVPDCTAESCNYFRKSLVSLPSAEDSGEVEEALTAAAAEGADTFAFTIGEGENFQSTIDEIIDGYAYLWIQNANSRNDAEHQLSDECRIYSYPDVSAAAIELEYE